MESSRRDLLNDMAEHRSISENNQNTRSTPVLVLYPKQVASPKTGVLILLCTLKNKVYCHAPYWISWASFGVGTDACYTV